MRWIVGSGRAVVAAAVFFGALHRGSTRAGRHHRRRRRIAIDSASGAPLDGARVVAVHVRPGRRTRRQRVLTAASRSRACASAAHIV